MKWIANKFQKGNFWDKLLWIAIITLTIIVGYITIDSVIFFLNTTVGTIGLLCIAPLVAIAFVGLSIIKHPRVKDASEYSDYTRKYL